jgi:hypothetical protein
MARGARHRRRDVGRCVIGLVAAAAWSHFAEAADPSTEGRTPAQAEARQTEAIQSEAGQTGAGRTEAWRTSPYHGAINGAGQPIPCLCRHRGRSYKLGEKVCLEMPNGVVLARCDMFLNNTSWIPTDEACTLSSRSGPTRTAQSFAKLASRQF